MVRPNDLPQSKKLQQFRSNLSKYEGFGFLEEEKSFCEILIRAQILNESYEGTGFLSYTEMCQPFLFFNGTAIDIGGVLNYDSVSQTGTFECQTQSGLLVINSVHSYHVFGEVFSGKISPFSAAYLPELSTLDDIYVSAVVFEEQRFILKIYHNLELVYQKENVFPLEIVDFGDLGLFKTHIPYVRFSVSADGIYYNYMFCLSDMKLYQLDDSDKIPSFLIDYSQLNNNWDRFRSKIFDKKKRQINIYLHLNSGKTSQIVADFIANADAGKTIKNIFEDDTTANLCISYVDRPEDVRFIYYCASIDPSILGTAIMDIPLDDLQKGTLNFRYECRYTADSNGIDLKYYKYLNRELFKKCNETPLINRLPKKITDTSISGREMAIYLFQFLRDNYNGKYAVHYLNARDGVRKEYGYEKERQLYKDIFQKIAATGKLSSRWKNEYSLYQLVKKHFPDTVYQYHSDWLGRQSLDIFIPHLQTAFEYQGKQHYEAVSFYDGEEGLAKQRFLDEQKRQLCQENGISLIEWKYDEPISNTLLKEKMKCLKLLYMQ